MHITLLRDDLERLLSAAASAAGPAGPAGPGGRPADLEALRASLRDPDLERLAEAGRVLDLELCRRLALLLKWDWERLVATQGGDGGAEKGAPLRAPYPLELARGLKGRFRPDGVRLHEALEEHGARLAEQGYDLWRLQGLVDEILHVDLHFAANDGPELAAFAVREAARRRVLQGASSGEQDRYWRAHSSWLALEDRLAEDLLFLEERRLENAHVHHLWLQAFGDAYLELERESVRLESAERRLNLLKADPALDEDGLERMVAEIEARRRRELEDLSLEASLASVTRQPRGEGSLSAEEVSAFRAESKRLLREIWLLIHPDKLARHPGAEKLTPAQRDHLQGLWVQLMAVGRDELGFSKGQMGYSYRSHEVLHDILHTAREILANAGCDLETRKLPAGVTLDEQVRWLEDRACRLEGEIDEVKAQLRVLLEDPGLKDKLLLLESPPREQERIAKEMRERAQGYRERAEELEREIEAVLATRSPR
ncbi:MAG: hypothetical protein HY721_08170 [Planctomycetes bacterium]|nr:hypothetical protein [Planctomycetota bacterium]